MISSFRNPLVKQIKRLRQRKFRRQEGLLFVEGPHGFLAAVESGAAIETAVFSSALLRSEACYQALDRLRQADVAVVELDAPVFAGISERENPAGIGAVVRQQWHELATFPLGPGQVAVALAGTADPGNLGTILRTVDAVGAAGVILAGPTTDPAHPTAVKASMGAVFRLPLCRVPGTEALLPWARERGVQLVATSARASQSFWQATYRLPALLLMGSERQGLPAETQAAADLAVSIPMHGPVTSLNLAVATSLLLYEIRRRQAGERLAQG